MQLESLCVALAGVGLCACVGEIDGTAVPEQLDVTPLERSFDDAARAYDVPASLLKAIGYVETRWQMVEGHDHHLEDGKPSNAAYGVMALRGDRLERGAELAGLDPDDVRYDAGANVAAAAALLSNLATEAGIDRADLGAWAPVVGEFSGIDDADARARYVVVNVYGTLALGAVEVAEDGTPIATLEPIDVVPDYDEPIVQYAAGGDYDGAVWRPSPNTSARPSGAAGKPSMVIIHTCEGAYSGCWGWLKNSASGVSAHYVVNETGSEITQLVSESRKAWHIGATYKCSLNSNVMCERNGAGSNNFTIGIEHAGYGSQATWSTGLLEASAKLVCDITRRNGIPRDATHIVGHGQLQPYNRSDPGPNWPWAYYLSRVQAHCGDGGGGTPPPDDGGGDPPPDDGGGDGGGGTAAEIVIDSNQSRNDPALAKVEVSGNWNASNSVAGYYGTGYWWASTAAVSDGASFWFYLDAAGDRTVEAWWSAASDRSPSAPFIAYDAAGAKLGVSYQDQRTNGQRWVTLGTYHFSAGWNRVMLSRWTGSGAVVIADAVRVR